MTVTVPLHFQPDPHNGVPVYRQLMDQVKYYLASGALRPGDQLPSIRELARALRINPATVVKAYTELEHEGILDRQQGRGVFVSGARKPLPKRALEAALRQRARQLAVEALQMGADPDTALRLLGEELRAIAPRDRRPKEAAE